MKLHILSDIHLEFGKWPKHIDVNAIAADASILAGDIGVGLAGIEWALTFERPVIYVMGNHEFYGQRPMAELWRKAREKVAGTHVHLLEDESVLIGDPQHPGENVRFLGATLWTDFCVLGPERQDECLAEADRTMSDFRSIFVSRRGAVLSEPGYTTQHGGDRLTPRKTAAFHADSRRFLQRELDHIPENRLPLQSWCKTVAVTHHAPSARSLVTQSASEPLDAAFASHLDDLVKHADLWVHGHTHIPVDYMVADRMGRVVSNPRGYVGVESVDDFDPTLVVEI